MDVAQLIAAITSDALEVASPETLTKAGEMLIKVIDRTTPDVAIGSLEWRTMIDIVGMEAGEEVTQLALRITDKYNSLTNRPVDE
jgi:hypothetical protein